MDAFEAFVKSLLRVPSTSSLIEYSEQLGKCHCNNTFDQSYFCAVEDLRMAISNDFLLYRVVIPRHSESDRTLLSSRPTIQRALEKLFTKSSEKVSLEYNYSNPKSKKYFWKKISVM